MNIQTNAVQEAVVAAGGPTRVANKLGVSSSTIHSWIKKGQIPKFDQAQAVSRLSKVPAARLRGKVEATDPTQDKVAELQVRDAMRTYLVDHCGIDPASIPTKTISPDETMHLDKQLIIQATCLMVLALNLSGGASGDLDLYKLIVSYMQDLELRRRLNLVLDLT